MPPALRFPGGNLLPSLPTLQPLDLYSAPWPAWSWRFPAWAAEACGRTTHGRRSSTLQQCGQPGSAGHIPATCAGRKEPAVLQLCVVGPTEYADGPAPRHGAGQWQSACMRNAARWTTRTRHALQRDLPRSGRRARAPAGVPPAWPGIRSCPSASVAPGASVGSMFCLNVGGLAHHLRGQSRLHRPQRHARTASVETGKAAGHSVMNRRRRCTGSNPSLRRVLYRAHLGVALVAVFTAGLAVTLVGLLTLRAYADPNQQLIARSISYTVGAAVVFGDAQAAEESLALIASSEEASPAPSSTTARDRPRPVGIGKAPGRCTCWNSNRRTGCSARRPNNRSLHDGQKIGFGGGEGLRRQPAALPAHRFPPAWSCACRLPPWAPSTCRGGWYAVSSARSTNWRRSAHTVAPRTGFREARTGSRHRRAEPTGRGLQRPARRTRALAGAPAGRTPRAGASGPTTTA